MAAITIHTGGTDQAATIITVMDMALMGTEVTAMATAAISALSSEAHSDSDFPSINDGPSASSCVNGTTMR